MGFVYLFDKSDFNPMEYVEIFIKNDCHATKVSPDELLRELVSPRISTLSHLL